MVFVMGVKFEQNFFAVASHTGRNFGRQVGMYSICRSRAFVCGDMGAMFLCFRINIFACAVGGRSGGKCLMARFSFDLQIIVSMAVVALFFAQCVTMRCGGKAGMLSNY